jgi:hypothetical protein
MTLIGAFSVNNSAVILADRQETISDYAKWDEGKIYLHEHTSQYRVVLAGAGDPDPINQIWVTIYLTYRKKHAIFIAWKA